MRKKSNLFTVHCVLHRHHLVAKRLSPSLQESLGAAVKAINKIKANAKNDQIFRQLCEANDEKFERLLIHTEVSWLSKRRISGKILQTSKQCSALSC